MRVFQKGFNFAQDGPGNRLVYHLQGCNMRCIWCSNPEGMKMSGGNEVSVKEILKECISSKPMFFSGGGVTFTGGEATLQHKDLNEILKLLKKEDIHTAIETNGTSRWLCELLHFVDYIIMDFKHYDSDAHLKYTGMDNINIKKNFSSICQSGRQLHVRIPLIKGINTLSPRGFTNFFAKHNTKNVVFEFLAYHEYGKSKWTEEYKVKDGFISAETLKEFTAAFEEVGLRVVQT